jgi:hypothetical protein
MLKKKIHQGGITICIKFYLNALLKYKRKKTARAVLHFWTTSSASSFLVVVYCPDNFDCNSKEQKTK